MLSNVIDWSKYGRVPAREQQEIQISYREEAGRIVCMASFPIDRLHEVFDRLKAQRDFWRRASLDAEGGGNDVA
jgi:hypothetical protein